eukprot:CAMPEP_0196159226 /NCGR_PEP_ID=MMETSP0910-20130528/46212_1 /TAXON_ID=49265 /ORGANISM="Thalassiosira rotula, Strain GSO102" /LENGTH=230 /DNA_ID=CAMNT_0041424143 /DNA_START=138 /DNA_END=826 /DNA_ORIENTATION=+
MVSYLKASALLSIFLPAISANNTSAHKILNPEDLDLRNPRESNDHQKDLHTKSGVGLASFADDPVKTLQSEECTPLVGALASSIGDIMRYPDEMIIDYFCNDVQRKYFIEAKAEMARDMVEQKDPCIKAVEEIDTTTPQSALDSKDQCAVAIQALLDGIDEARDLAEVRVGAVEVDPVIIRAVVQFTVRTAIGVFRWWLEQPDEDEAEEPPQDSFGVGLASLADDPVKTL